MFGGHLVDERLDTPLDERLDRRGIGHRAVENEQQAVVPVNQLILIVDRMGFDKLDVVARSKIAKRGLPCASADSGRDPGR